MISLGSQDAAIALLPILLSGLENIALVGEWPGDVTKETVDIMAQYHHHSIGPNALPKLTSTIIHNRFGAEDNAMEQVVALAQLPSLQDISANRMGGPFDFNPLWSLGPRISNVEVFNMQECRFENNYFSSFVAGFNKLYKLSCHKQADLGDEN